MGGIFNPATRLGASYLAAARLPSLCPRRSFRSGVSLSNPTGNAEAGKPAQSGGLAQLKGAFERASAEKRAALLTYITAGFPTVDQSIDAMLGMQQGGADIIEVGMPFTDPMADGSTIQRANELALASGVDSVTAVLNVIRQARERGLTVPIVLMGYYNPLLSHATRAGNVEWSILLKECQALNVCGFIVVDLPPEESTEFRQACASHQLSYIPLVAPTTTPDRLAHLTRIADSFIYAVSLTGVTGARSSISSELPEFIQRIRRNTSLPVAIGFGISKPEHFASVAGLGDGVVVGSAIVSAAEQAGQKGSSIPKAVSELCRSLTSGAQQKAPRSLIQAPPAAIQIKEEKTALDPYRFGEFGGRYVPETLVSALDQLDREYTMAKNDPEFQALVRSYDHFIGRPSHCYYADRLTKHAGGAKIFLKREDMNHTGSHKINNGVAQALLALRLGKKRIIAETGAGQHGVASATICAKLGLDLVVYMGADDCKRQSLNVFRMEMLGAQVVPVTSGSRTLKDAINEAMRDWVTNIRTTHYLVGSAIGPHPFPTIVRDFQSVIGQEARRQIIEMTGRLPDAAVACVGGGSNAIGMFHPFVNDPSVRLIGVEAGGSGVKSGRHSATLSAGRPGVLHGTRTYLLQDETGQILETHSISAGLDYPGVGPEHAFLKDSGRAEYVSVDDKGALEGFLLLARTEGIIPALESAHAITYAVELAKTMKPDQSIVVSLSGRGDKDVEHVRDNLASFGLRPATTTPKVE